MDCGLNFSKGQSSARNKDGSSSISSRPKIPALISSSSSKLHSISDLVGHRPSEPIRQFGPCPASIVIKPCRFLNRSAGVYWYFGSKQFVNLSQPKHAALQSVAVLVNCLTNATRGLPLKQHEIGGIA
jgi:hypothetical protein